MINKRINSLDYLRGLMALSIMLFHYHEWYLGVLDESSLLSKLGVYAVSIFYILSGLSLSIVYKDRLNNISAVVEFVVKRLFRIIPLFWFVTTTYVALKVLYLLVFGVDEVYSFTKMFLNYTLIFGFVSPSSYIPIGGWSLGNEVVFYFIFPIIVYKMNIKKVHLFLFFSLILGFAFSFYLISENINLSEQWGLFINPLNQIYFFVLGVCLGVYSKRFKKIDFNYFLIAFFILVSLASFYPIGSTINQLVTGWTRLFFSVWCVLFVVLFLSLGDIKNIWIHKFLAFLGDKCYSIYLIHPVVSIVIFKLFSIVGLNVYYTVIFSVLITFFTSSLVYNYIEKPSMIFGKSIFK